MLESLKWRITCRWGAALQHLRLLLISCYAICRALACFCNTLRLIVDPEYRGEFQQLKPMPSHLPGAWDMALAFTVPATQPVSCWGALHVRLCWGDLLTPDLPPEQWCRGRGTEVLPCDRKGCPTNHRSLRATKSHGPLHQRRLVCPPLWRPVQGDLTAHVRWCSRQMCYSISLWLWLCADMRKRSAKDKLSIISMLYSTRAFQPSVGVALFSLD